MSNQSPGDSGNTSQPDQVNVTLPGGDYGGIYIPTTTVTSDNVWKSQVSSDLAGQPGDPTVTTVDVDSLDKAITWLNTWADYLKRIYHGMDDIKSLMDGPQMDPKITSDAGLSGQSGGPLGGFPWAGKLAERHTSLFQSYNGGLKTVVDNLYDAADALKKVKDKYNDVEHANAMSAAEMESDFQAAQSQSHNV